MKEFEYKVECLYMKDHNMFRDAHTVRDLEAQLNMLGMEGWELVYCVDGFFFFKREI